MNLRASLASWSALGLLLCSLSLPWARNSWAQDAPPWLAEIKDCSALRGEIQKRFGVVSDLTRFSPAERTELEQVIEVACGEQFNSCQFKICTRRGALLSSQPSSLLQSSSQSSQTAAEALLEALGIGEELSRMIDENELNRPSLLANSSSSSSYTTSSAESSSEEVESSSSSSDFSSSTSIAFSRPAPIVTDPLAWLARDLTCLELHEQIEARYRVFGSFEELPETKQQEYLAVHEIACGERYQHCELSSCEVLNPDYQQARARTTYRELYSLHSASQRQSIDERVKYETEKGLLWERFAVDDDAPEERTERERPAEKAAPKVAPRSEAEPSPVNSASAAPALTPEAARKKALINDLFAEEKKRSQNNASDPDSPTRPSRSEKEEAATPDVNTGFETEGLPAFPDVSVRPRRSR